MVDIMAGPGITDYQALYDKMKAEQALYIQIKWSLQAGDPSGYVEKTAAIRYRFKLAHIRMRVLEAGLKERGIYLQGPDERCPCLRQVAVEEKSSSCCVIS